jgi:hypothetical protein
LIILIFVAVDSISWTRFLLTYLFSIFNYDIDYKFTTLFTIIFTISHLLSYKINFLNKLNQENFETNLEMPEKSFFTNQEFNIFKAIKRIATMNITAFVGIFFAYICIMLGFQDYMKYYVIIYCALKGYTDYYSHIAEHRMTTSN